MHDPITFILANPWQHFNTLSMLRLPLPILLVISYALSAQPSETQSKEFDLVATYQASIYVFYGEVSNVLPENKFKTGSQGVYLKDVTRTELTLEPVIWPKAKALNFAVEDNFKNPLPEGVEVYLPKPDPDIWTYIESDIGDAFLAKPNIPEAHLHKLYTGDKGLFFIRYQAGTNLPVLYRVQVGKLARESIALLRADASNPNVNLAQVVQHRRLQQQQLAEKEAAEFKVFEDEYYKILRVRELDIRQSLLKDLVVKMGFEGRWDYFSFKERYILEHGDHVSGKDIPSGPTSGKEKLWHDISGELEKIEVILKARG